MTTAKKVGRRYTMGSRRWPDGEYWELIDGEAYDMTPAQSIRHQTILGILHHRLIEFFAGKSCSPFLAPTDVVFDESNIVQPDILVVCDKNKITAANIQGAPDLIAEILSPSTSLKDKREKKALYERFGVREYIIVNPFDDTVERFCLESGRYGSPYLTGTKICHRKSFRILSLS